MTTYFDRMQERVADVQRTLAQLRSVAGGPDDQAAIELTDKLNAIEREVVNDVTICAEWPGCPEGVRDAIHRVALRYGPTSQPSIAVNPDAPDFDDLDGHVRCIDELVCHLHTVFHNLAYAARERGLVGFSDDPLAPLRDLCGAGEHRRARTLAPNLRYFSHMLDGTAADDGPAIAEVAQWAHDHALRAGSTAEQAEKARADAEAALQKVECNCYLLGEHAVLRCPDCNGTGRKDRPRG